MKTVMSLCLQRRIRKKLLSLSLLLLTIIIYIVISTFFVLYLVLLFLRRGCEACLSSRQLSFLKGLVFVVFVYFSLRSLHVSFVPHALKKLLQPIPNQSPERSHQGQQKSSTLYHGFSQKYPFISFLLSNYPSFKIHLYQTIVTYPPFLPPDIFLFTRYIFFLEISFFFFLLFFDVFGKQAGSCTPGTKDGRKIRGKVIAKFSFCLLFWFYVLCICFALCMLLLDLRFDFRSAKNILFCSFLTLLTLLCICPVFFCVLLLFMCVFGVCHGLPFCVVC